MKYFPVYLLAAVFGSAAAPCHAADLPRTVAIQVDSPGVAVPQAFSGLSFEMQDVVQAKDGSRLFQPDNAPLVGIFKQLGIHSLRVGGNTADRPTVPVPSEADIDSLFAFARAVDAKVIFTLRLRRSDPSAAVPIARYVAAHYAASLSCFAIGNEPNVYAKTYPEYVAMFKTYLAAVTAAGVAPNAVFCGPSTTPGKAEWARNLAQDFGKSGRLVMITQHEYVGGNSNKVTDVAAARDRLLSPSLLPGYEKILTSFAPAAAAADLPFRLEETNSYFNGGAKDVSNTLAAALWAIDYLHWWAAHGAQGINFHTGDWVAAGEKQTRCWYASFWNDAGGCEAHPIAYALKAFALGGYGQILPTSIGADASSGSITAYAVLAADGHVYCTLVDKDHGAAAGPVPLAFSIPGCAPSRVITLTAPGGDVAATDTVTLGGSAIAPDGSWGGKWTSPPSGPITIAPGSAIVVDLTKR